MLAGAQRDLARYQTLVAQNSIARQTADDQAATVKQDEGTVLADQGAVAGRPGQRALLPDHLAGRRPRRRAAGRSRATSSPPALTTGIVSVNQIEPIAVTFTVPQGDFQRLSAVSGGFTRPLAAQALSQETGADLGVGRADRRRQPRRPDHRHGAAEGALRQRRPAAVAGPVRQRAS